MRECEQVSEARVTAIDLGTGLASAVLELPRSLFYETLSQQSGFQIGDDGDLMALLTQLAQVKAKYDKVADALKEVEETGYGIVVPPSTPWCWRSLRSSSRGGDTGSA